MNNIIMDVCVSPKVPTEESAAELGDTKNVHCDKRRFDYYNYIVVENMRTTIKSAWLHTTSVSLL